jgi:hypothetical protein
VNIAVQDLSECHDSFPSFLCLTKEKKQKKVNRCSPLAKNPLHSVKYLRDSLRSPKDFLTLTHRIFFTRRRDAGLNIL